MSKPCTGCSSFDVCIARIAVGGEGVSCDKFSNKLQKSKKESKQRKVTRPAITKFLGELLISEKFSGIGKYWASEVTLDYGHGQGKEKRVDFMQFKPKSQFTVSGLEKGEFICYEIKSCKADVFSGHGLNFEGEKNYIVTTMETWKDLISDGQERIPHYVGIMVACCKDKYAEFENPTPLSEDGYWRLEIVRPAHPTDRKRSITELLFCMLRSGH